MCRRDDAACRTLSPGPRKKVLADLRACQAFWATKRAKDVAEPVQSVPKGTIVDVWFLMAVRSMQPCVLQLLVQRVDVSVDSNSPAHHQMVSMAKQAPVVEDV